MLISNDNRYIVQVIYKDNISSPKYLHYDTSVDKYLTDDIEFSTIFKSIDDAKTATLHFYLTDETNFIKEFRIVSCKLSTINFGETIWVIGNGLQ